MTIFLKEYENSSQELSETLKKTRIGAVAKDLGPLMVSESGFSESSRKPICCVPNHKFEELSRNLPESRKSKVESRKSKVFKTSKISRIGAITMDLSPSA